MDTVTAGPERVALFPDLTAEEEQSELEAARAWRQERFDVGIGMVAPAFLGFGSDVAKARLTAAPGPSSRNSTIVAAAVRWVTSFSTSCRPPLILPREGDPPNSSYVD